MSPSSKSKHDTTVIKCRKHLKHKQSPGVCSLCLRDKLSQLAAISSSPLLFGNCKNNVLTKSRSLVSFVPRVRNQEGESKKKKWHVAPSGHQMALVRQAPVAPTLPGNGLQQMLFNSSKPNLYLAAGGLEQKQATSSPSLRTHLLQFCEDCGNDFEELSLHLMCS
ncbi:hypothetical protein WN944_003937 [Citrus x changshan-huyou]|uniref:Uncharacterized protein n=1 Tax=Citrus x changshan-huyou TaxID=2935761 RepID=A0AAP0LZH4_9ROSI